MDNKHKQFKPFDRVIYRLNYSTPTAWHCGIFSDYNKQNNHITLCSGFAFLLDKYDILPYEGNEHLVGISDEPEEVIKLEEGEYIICFDQIQSLNEKCATFCVFNKIEGGYFFTNHLCWSFAIRFSDFNPDDMEETRRHILCVKNGKIVKYHGKN